MKGRFRGNLTEKEVILTAEGFQRLSEEIEYLSTIKREEVSERIKEAREFGDISENSEYNEAKNEQAKLEMRIGSLEQKLRNARVLSGAEIKTDAVGIGCKVHIEDAKHGDSFTYVVVGSVEADPANKKLSNEVSGRQGDHGPQGWRDRQGSYTARRRQVQDRFHQKGIAWPKGRCPEAGERRRKLDNLLESGQSPYRNRFPDPEPVALLLERYEAFENGQSSDDRAPRRLPVS